MEMSRRQYSLGLVTRSVEKEEYLNNRLKKSQCMRIMQNGSNHHNGRPQRLFARDASGRGQP